MTSFNILYIYLDAFRVHRKGLCTIMIGYLPFQCEQERDLI